MTGIQAYILSKKLALSMKSGIKSISLTDAGKLTFTLNDGTIQTMNIPLPEDGVSPTVTITPIDGGHRVSITDATGPHEFDVMDGSDSGVNNLSDAPLGIAVTEHIPKKDDYINFPMENIFGALPTAGGPFTAIVFSLEGVSKCSCKVSDSYKPGYWVAMTQVQFADSIDLNNYYNKSEVDEKVAAAQDNLASGILLYGSVVDPIVKNQSTTVTENFFVGPLPKVNDAGYGLLEQSKKLYRVAYKVSSISSDNLFTIVYTGEPELVGGEDNPTWVGYTHQQAQLSGNLIDVVSIVDNDKCSVVPEIGSYGLVIAEGADETQRYVMYCQAIAPSPGHEIEGTTTIRIKYALPVSGGGTVDLSDYYTKSEVDSKINPTWIAYSPEEYVLDGVNDTYAMWLDNSRFSTPAAVGSYGLVIAKGQVDTDGTEAKNWIFVGEVLLPNSPIEGKTFVQVKFLLEIGSGNTNNELITIKDTIVNNISQLPEEPCCIHAINSQIGFALKDDIVYVKPLTSTVEIYTIDGSIATVNVDPDTGAFTTGGPVEHWAKESDVYNKSQVDNLLSTMNSRIEQLEAALTSKIEQSTTKLATF